MSNTRPDRDALAEAFQQGLLETRRNPGGTVPVRDQLAEDMRATLAPITEQIISNAVRPWRRIVFWFAPLYAVLFAGSIVQAVLWWAAK